MGMIILRLVICSSVFSSVCKVSVRLLSRSRVVEVDACESRDFGAASRGRSRRCRTACEKVRDLGGALRRIFHIQLVRSHHNSGGLRDTMARVQDAVSKAGKKRKHEDDGEEPGAAVKKSKSASRSERRRERLRENATRPHDRNNPLGEHEIKVKSGQEAKRAERKRQRKAAASGTLDKPTEDVLAEGGADHDRLEDKRERKKQAKALKKAQRKREEEQEGVKTIQQPKQLKQPEPKQKARWILSGPTAGRFIDHDPLFVRNASGEDFLIAAVAHELRVFSMDTSLLVRALPAPTSATIVGYATESPESKLVYIAYSNGAISGWDWTDDVPPRSIPGANADVKSLVAGKIDDRDEAGVAYLARQDNMNFVTALRGDLYKTKAALQSLRLLGKGDYLVAHGSSAVAVGRRKDDTAYTWVELPLTKPATCVDARMILPPPGSKKASKRQPQLQLVVGHEDGQIHLYDDVSALLSPDQQPRLPPPRVLHWHRDAVSSVKFSPDGNYVISGGKETVLVLWQLETGKQQYLPHLTSEIQRIAVNAQGDRYALQMGDNSIMVLSTAELKPVANFAGLQLRTAASMPVEIPAAVLRSDKSHQLLLSVPATQPKTALEAAPRPFLQTFDLRTSLHVTRQALTRNNATDLNVGPEDNAVLPPDVAHIAVSQDGEWLATVDEWVPPSLDVQHLASSRDGVEEARRSRREVYLKFWHWDTSQEMWTLSTRADSPHRRAGARSLGAGQILTLVSDPASNSFATVGEDSCVMMWKPRTRIRGGVAMEDAQDVELIEWSCKRTVQLAGNATRADTPMEIMQMVDQGHAVAAYSNDGSLLAVSSATPNTLDDSLPAVTFIDTATGAIRSITTGLADTTAVTAIAFLDRYFITVTRQTAFVWDLVTDKMQQKIKLAHIGSDFDPLLAVNETDQTFAIVTAAEKPGKQTRVVVHTTKHTHQVYRREFQTGVVKVLSGNGSRGFTLLFADATVGTVSPTGINSDVNLSALNTESSALAPAAVGADMDVDKSDDDEEATMLLGSSAVKSEVDGVPTFETDEDDRPVVRPEQLAGILDVGQSFAMQPVKDMFQAVVGLFGRRPQQAAL